MTAEEEAVAVTFADLCLAPGSRDAEADPEAGDGPGFAAVEPRVEEIVEIPDAARRLDGKKVAIEGTVQPLEWADGEMQSFLLLGSQGSCCYGSASALNEWIRVEVVAGRVPDDYLYGNLLVVGELEVGEDRDEFGAVSSLYRMRASRLVSLR